jgi:hypothetical protein
MPKHSYASAVPTNLVEQPSDNDTASVRRVGKPAYKANKDAATDTIIESDPVAVALLTLAEQNPGGWKDSLAAMALTLADIAGDDSKKRAWPDTPESQTNP